MVMVLASPKEDLGSFTYQLPVESAWAKERIKAINPKMRIFRFMMHELLRLVVSVCSDF